MRMRGDDLPPLARHGQRIVVGGRRVYLVRQGVGQSVGRADGRPSQPSVVLETGLGHVSAVWGLVQPGVARFADVLAYDRAGYGWSDPGPRPRASARIVAELHALLGACALPPPYLLVGQSFGGLTMLLYAVTYPDEVAGVALLDPLPPQLARDDPANFRFFIRWNRLQYRALAAAVRLGLYHRYSRARGEGSAPQWVWRLPPERRAAALAEQLRGSYAAAVAETEALGDSAAQTLAALGRFPPVPLTVLAHDLPDLFAGRMSPRDVTQAERVWRAAQTDLAAISPRGRLLVAERAGHKIHIDQPARVVEAIRALLTAR